MSNKSDDDKKNLNEKRDSVRKLLVGGGVVGASQMLPSKWGKTVVDSVVLPAHAQMSPGPGGDDGGDDGGGVGSPPTAAPTSPPNSTRPPVASPTPAPTMSPAATLSPISTPAPVATPAPSAN